MYVDYVVWNANFNSSFLGSYLKVFLFCFKILTPYQSEENLSVNVEFYSVEKE